MLISENGETVGSLSAGCLEEEIALQARDVLRTGQPVLMSFDTRKRFGCAGKIDIFIECATENFFSGIAKSLDARRSCCAITRVSGDETGSRIVEGDYEHPPSRSNGATSEPELIQKIRPPIRLMLFGGGPDGAPLYSLADSLGWQTVTVEIATANELLSVSDEWTAAIVKSHSYGQDFAALQKLLPLELRYVGLIGPRRRRNQLLSDLLDLGVTINAGFFAPAGLDLGAETPEEIALAIVSDADFQQFVQDPRKLKEFLIANKVFPETEQSKRLSEITHWASLMSATYQEDDPDPWLLTIVHGNPCRGAVASQPFEQ